MNEYTALQINCFMVGFIGGLCGMTIALSALRMFFVKHYMRYSKTKDYLQLEKRINEFQNQILTLSILQESRINDE